MKSFESIIAVVLIFVIVFTGVVTVGEEIQTNSNLDSDSVALIGNLSGELENNFNNSDLGETVSNLSANASFEGQDPFTLQFLEGKSEAQKKLSLVGKIIRTPEFVLISLGVPREDVNVYLALLSIIFTLCIAFATYRAFFGGGKLTDN